MLTIKKFLLTQYESHYFGGICAQIQLLILLIVWLQYIVLFKTILTVTYKFLGDEMQT